MSAPRLFRFYAVGAAGMAIQGIVFTFLTLVLSSSYMVSAAVSVEAAVLHNFFWHRRWTWAEQPQSTALRQLLKFNLTTGLASILGNLFFMRLLAGAFGVQPWLASFTAIACCSMLNFILSNQLVFARERKDAC